MKDSWSNTQLIRPLPRHLNAEFQRIARRDKKAFLSDHCKEIEENNRMGKIRDLVKKIRDTKGTCHAKMGSIKDRNGRDLTEAVEKAMAPLSSILAWKIPWMEEPGGLQSMGLLRVGHDFTFTFTFSLSCIGEGNGNPLQCSCLENPRDGGACWADVYGVIQSRTRLKWLSSSSNRSRRY